MRAPPPLHGYRDGYRALGGRGFAGTCPPCHVPFGTECVPCPNGSPLKECSTCVDGEPVEVKSWWEKSGFLGPVLVQIVGSVVVFLVVATLTSPEPKRRAASRRRRA